MANQADYFWSYLPFWIVNYGLAIVIWSCVGRFLLYFLVVGRHPQNYIWRAFLGLTEWAVRLFGFITPKFVHPIFLSLIAAFWLYYARIGLFFVFSGWGLTPPLTGPGG